MAAAATAFTEAFIVVVLAAIIFLYIRQYYGEVTFVRSRVDDRVYLVRKLPDRQLAADMLGEVNKRLTELVRHLAAKHPGDAAVRRLYANYNPESLSEGGTEVGYTSYSVNKGERVVLCLRQTDNSFVDSNVLMYVAVHELGHLMSESVGHNDEFWANFKRLLRAAVELGLYTRVDYAGQPQSYCGIRITSSII